MRMMQRIVTRCCKVHPEPDDHHHPSPLCVVIIRNLTQHHLPSLLCFIHHTHKHKHTMKPGPEGVRLLVSEASPPVVGGGSFISKKPREKAQQVHPLAIGSTVEPENT
jgi:hypothetical protein